MNEEDHKDDHFSTAYSLKNNDETKLHYRSWAASYDREVADENDYAQPRRVSQLLMRFCPDENTKIVDAGCGTGLSGIALQQSGYQAIDGCDFSPEMLVLAREKNCYQHLFQCNLNEGLPDVAEATYNAVTCVGVFSFGHVFPDAVDDLLRVLAVNGILIIALNEQYWSEGGLQNKLQTLVDEGRGEILVKEFGDHLPGHDVKGWVIAIKKLAQ